MCSVKLEKKSVTASGGKPVNFWVKTFTTFRDVAKANWFNQ